MNILLINPPFYRIIGFYNRYFPFGVALLSAVLRGLGHDVRVYDADFTERPVYFDYSRLPEKYPEYLRSFTDGRHPVWSEVRSVIADFRPELVGVSAFTTFAASAFHVAKLSKALFPECPVVLGGPHATVRAGEVLRICPSVDYVVRGEGEETLAELVDALGTARPSPGSIRGLSYRSAGSIAHNLPRERCADLDRIPFPDRGLLMNEKKYSSEDMGLIMSSRGCPYSCAYCATDARRVSYRSPDNVLAEIRAVKEKYGTTQFTFKDDSFTVSRKRVAELCTKLIDQKLRIRWECNTRVNLIDGDLLLLMKRAGCNFIKVGIESGSERVLKRMNKGITLDQARRAAGLLRRSGIHWTAYFMMGVPGETEEDVNRTVDLLYEIRPDTALIGVYEPFPGTAMFDDGIRRNLVRADMSLEDFYTMLPNHYYRKDPAVQTDGMPPEAFRRLEQEVKKAFHDYNKRFGNVLKTAMSKTAVYLREPAILLEDVKKYVSYRHGAK